MSRCTFRLLTLEERFDKPEPKSRRHRPVAGEEFARRVVRALHLRGKPAHRVWLAKRRPGGTEAHVVIEGDWLGAAAPYGLRVARGLVARSGTAGTLGSAWMLALIMHAPTITQTPACLPIYPWFSSHLRWTAINGLDRIPESIATGFLANEGTLPAVLRAMASKHLGGRTWIELLEETRGDKRLRRAVVDAWAEADPRDVYAFLLTTVNLGLTPAEGITALTLTARAELVEAARRAWDLWPTPRPVVAS